MDQYNEEDEEQDFMKPGFSVQRKVHVTELNTTKYILYALFLIFGLNSALYFIFNSQKSSKEITSIAEASASSAVEIFSKMIQAQTSKIEILTERQEKLLINLEAMKNVQAKPSPAMIPLFCALPDLKHRDEFGDKINELGYTKGAELGVQRGEFAKHNLQQWTKCTEYHLVDLWAHQENYHDIANFDNNKQEELMHTTQENLKQWLGKTVWHRNYTSAAVKEVKDGSLDWVYVDARHDYKGALEDITLWWPKIRIGGMLAGHDYLDVNDLHDEQDWSISADGTNNGNKAVKSAVNEWAALKNLEVGTTKEDWPSWYMMKCHD